VDRAASRKAHDRGASTLKPATTLVMLRGFSESGYPSYGCGVAQATSFDAWLGMAGFRLARCRWAGLERRAAMGKSVREVVGRTYL
jgi:hypothetical protein